jgi:putative endonuclease
MALTQGATIYILRCSDGSYCTGMTRRSVDDWVSEHAQGLIKGYTEGRLPVELVFSGHNERIDEAVAAERRIKGRSRAKKEAMMRNDFAALSACQAQTKAPKPKIDPSSFEKAPSAPPQDEGS